MEFPDEVKPWDVSIHSLHYVENNSYFYIFILFELHI